MKKDLSVSSSSITLYGVHKEMTSHAAPLHFDVTPPLLFLIQHMYHLSFTFVSHLVLCL